MKFSDRRGEVHKEKLADEEYDHLVTMLEVCDEHMARFNGWEEEFIENMFELCKAKAPLSVRQREIIGNLYDKATKQR